MFLGDIHLDHKKGVTVNTVTPWICRQAKIEVLNQVAAPVTTAQTRLYRYTDFPPKSCRYRRVLLDDEIKRLQKS
jgi:hypothetical protein